MIDKIVLGTMEFGRRLNQNQSKEMILKFVEKGFNEIDTASLYAYGETEKIIGKCNDIIKENNLKIATKVNPNWVEKGAFLEEQLKKQFYGSLESLKEESIDMLYLHWPSKTDSLEETLKIVDKLYRAKKFKRFGLSNYPSWEVAKIYGLCEKYGWIKPTIYQGMYNMLTRTVENELIPCLRNYGISFYAYNPLAGGILTGRYKYDDLNKFDNKTIPNRFYKIGGSWAKSYQERFWKINYFNAVNDIENELLQINNKTSKLSIDETYSTPNIDLLKLSFSWIMNYSCLDTKYGDALIIGASSLDQFQMNMNILSDRILISNDFLSYIDFTYKKHICSSAPNYFR